MTPNEFIPAAYKAAVESGHIFPDFAACEAALESGWGNSTLCLKANNLFGQKQGETTEGYPTIEIPTREFLHGEWTVVPATWPKFPTWADSFEARMKLLRALSVYADALAATDGEEFITLVSKHWSTDPERASKVMQIWCAHHNEMRM